MSLVSLFLYHYYIAGLFYFRFFSYIICPFPFLPPTNTLTHLPTSHLSLAFKFIISFFTNSYCIGIFIYCIYDYKYACIFIYISLYDSLTCLYIFGTVILFSCFLIPYYYFHLNFRIY